VCEALDKQRSRLRPEDTLLVVVGYDPVKKRPKGVDEIAYHWAVTHQNNPTDGLAAVGVETHPAAWEALGKGAGFARNGEMVDAGAFMALVFILDDSPGASDCLKKIKKARINHLVFSAYS
jgi:hypothetical protein